MLGEFLVPMYQMTASCENEAYAMCCLGSVVRSYAVCYKVMQVFVNLLADRVATGKTERMTAYGLRLIFE